MKSKHDGQEVRRRQRRDHAGRRIGRLCVRGGRVDHGGIVAGAGADTRQTRKRAHKNRSEWRRNLWRRWAVHTMLQQHGVRGHKCGKVQPSTCMHDRVVQTGIVDFTRLQSHQAVCTLADRRRGHPAAEAYSLRQEESPGDDGGAEQCGKRDGNKHASPGLQDKPPHGIDTRG